MQLERAWQMAAVLFLLGSACSSSHSGAGAGAGGSAGKASAGQGGPAAESGKGGTAAGAGRAGTGSAGRAGSAGMGAAGSGGDLRSCEQASDCGYGEIDHEILNKSDCMCLFGCASLPLNKTTIMRRQAQYTALCDPRTNGQGQPCPIDDCIQLPAASCTNHMCVAGQR